MDTAGSDAAIGSRDLIRRGSISLGDAFKYEPGVSVPFDFTGADPLVPYLGSGEKSINVRGVEGNRISMSIDGIKQPQEFLVAGGMSGAGRIYFDPATLAQFELFKSASSSIYGSGAMGGSINGKTVSPETLLNNDMNGRVARNSCTFSSVNKSFNNRFAAAYGNGRFAHSLVYSFRERSERKNNSDFPSDPQDSTSNAVVVKTLFIKDLWKFTSTVDFFEQCTFTDVNSIETGNNKKVTHENEKSRNRLSLQAELSPNEQSEILEKLMTRIYWQESNQNSINLQERLDNNIVSKRNIGFETKFYGLDIENVFNFDFDQSNHNILTGIELSFSDVSSTYLKTDVLLDGSVNLDNRKSMAPSESERLGAFVLDEISLGADESWLITPSFRFDYYKVKPKSDTSFLNNTSSVGFNPLEFENIVLGSPGLSVLKYLNSKTNIYFSYNHGIRNPSAEELNGFFEHPPVDSTTSAFIINANPNLEEEISDSFEIGLQAWSSLSVYEISFFKNFYDGFIELTKQPNSGVLDIYSNENIGKVEIYGLEFKWDWESQKQEGNVNLYQAGISASWSVGKRTDLGQPLNSIEPWKSVFYSGISSSNKTWGSRISFTYQSAKESKDIHQVNYAPPSIQDSLVVDLITWYKIGENWSLRGGLNNLTNEKYFLWSSARRGGGHSSSSTEERNRQPGLNGFLGLDFEF